MESVGCSLAAANVQVMALLCLDRLGIRPELVEGLGMATGLDRGPNVEKI